MWLAVEGSPYEEWRNITAGAASLATVVGFMAGGVWAWFRFRRTPESRVKIDLTVQLDWPAPTGSWVVVRVKARNDGGHAWSLWWSDQYAYRPAALSGPPVLTGSGSEGEGHDYSRVSVWTLARSESNGGSGYADWGELHPSRAELGCEDIRLRPGDTWTNDILFAVGADPVAIRAGCWVWVRSRRRIYPIERSCVLIRPAEGERH